METFMTLETAMQVVLTAAETEGFKQGLMATLAERVRLAELYAEKNPKHAGEIREAIKVLKEQLTSL
jgi:hypothetical protein